MRGVTVLDNELFVRFERDKNGIAQKIIKVYDAVTFEVKVSLKVPGLGKLRDMTSCRRFRCIYIADELNCMVHRINRMNTDNNIERWSVGAVPCSLSVNSAFNVLVTFNDEPTGKIKEFTTDGKLVREINVSADVKCLWHAVELTTNQFVICHGSRDDPLHRVCTINSEGIIEQVFGDSSRLSTSSLRFPLRIVVNRFIFIADQRNGRIVILNPSLEFVSAVTNNMKAPYRLWFDEQASQLYVADVDWETERTHLNVYTVCVKT